MLHVQNLTYRIGGRELFNGAQMCLSKGQRAAIVGQNGTGKSTLFRLIQGELQPDGGEVSVPNKMRIATLEQEVDFGNVTALEYVIAASGEQDLYAELGEETITPERIAEIYEQLEDMDVYSGPARAAKILKGLGFEEEEQHRPASSFSGGWRMRIALAACLFAEPDLLLLDEPTNHLDLESTAWLIQYLKSYPRTLLIISHDRYLLNEVAQQIFHLQEGKLTAYFGNFDFFEKTFRETMAHRQAQLKKQEAARKHIGAFIERFRAKSSKAKQVQSRIKMLEKFDPINLLKEEANMNLSFPQPSFLAPPLITLNKVTVGYEEKIVLQGLNQRIDFDDRIALLGKNGNGKSTFAKLIAGLLKPMKGQVAKSDKLKVGYFHQYQIEALQPHKTAFDHLREKGPEEKDQVIRERLGRFGFTREKVFQPVGSFSGGEKTRLNFALVTYNQPQILILDEPTNHLDMQMRESLVMAINEFEGAVILISHDWHLLELTVDHMWLVADQKVVPYPETLADYQKEILGISRAKQMKSDKLSQDPSQNMKKKFKADQKKR